MKAPLIALPHKPLLLLAVLDRFAEGSFKSNLIEFDDDLNELFALYLDNR
jgi:predicted restriction endonuclease